MVTQREAEAYHLVKVHGMKQREAAEHMGLTTVTVGQLVQNYIDKRGT